MNFLKLNSNIHVIKLFFASVDVVNPLSVVYWNLVVVLKNLESFEAKRIAFILSVISFVISFFEESIERLH